MLDAEDAQAAKDIPYHLWTLNRWDLSAMFLCPIGALVDLETAITEEQPRRNNRAAEQR